MVKNVVPQNVATKKKGQNIAAGNLSFGDVLTLFGRDDILNNWRFVPKLLTRY